MPNTKSAKKAMRQSRRRNLINNKTRAKVKSAAKSVKKFIASGQATEAVEALRIAMAALDKATKKGILHKNTASRKKSRYAKAIGKLKK